MTALILEIKHCEIRVGFGPDEEIGVGANSLMQMTLMLTLPTLLMVDPRGTCVRDFLSAAAAELHFQGRNVHPGTAKGQMVNALLQLAIDFHNQLPGNDRPELDRWLPRFLIILWMCQGCEEARASYIIRDFEKNALKLVGKPCRTLLTR